VKQKAICEEGIRHFSVCLHTDMTQDCIHNSFSVETLCSQIEREHCLALPNVRQLELSFAILALLGGATIVVARVLRVNNVHWYKVSKTREYKDETWLSE
jgi:hypothetical protein